jgi:3-oxoacyl-[acyl-carrier-protein] synthase II
MRRVVITGLGLVTPLGADVETAWANLIAGKSGAGPITRFDASDQKCRIACEVKPADHPYGFDPNKRVDHKVQRQVDPFIIFGIDAAGQAACRLFDRIGHRWPAGDREREPGAG